MFKIFCNYLNFKDLNYLKLNLTRIIRASEIKKIIFFILSKLLN